MIRYQNTTDISSAMGSTKPRLRIDERELSVGCALRVLIAGEIGHAARVLVLEPSCVKVRSYSSLARNTLMLTSSPTELTPLVMAVSYYVLGCPLRSAELEQAATQRLGEIPDLGYRLNDFDQMSSYVALYGMVRSVAMLSVGIQPSIDMSDVPTGDILTAAQRHLDGGVPFLQLLSA